MGITITGLGPGNFKHITLETWELLTGNNPVLLRTAKHPCVETLKARGVPFTSFDYLYDQAGDFAGLYQEIAAAVIEKAKQGQDIVYVVPGSPLVAEKTVELISLQAKAAGIELTIVPAMSFLEVLYTRLGIDPITGVTIVDAADLALLPPDLATGLIVTQVYSRQVASDAKLTLMDYYGDEYQVTVVRHLGLPEEQIINTMLFELDRLNGIDHLTSVYVPPRPVSTKVFSLDPVVDVMARLRSPGGCVWDIEQTHLSLRRYIVEEVYEVLEAIELADGVKLCEELGDLLLQIVFHARVAEESGGFTMQDVIDSVTEKMIRRHPHVFGGITVRDAAEVVVNWEKIKKREKAGEREKVLDGVPIGLPALMTAYKLQSKAAKVGFDWQEIGPVWDKVAEELAELKEAAALPAAERCLRMEDELGDVLFAIVNLARFMGIDAEIALNHTNNKFRRRFDHIETSLKQQNKRWEDVNLADLDGLWEEAKKKEVKS
ncbi:nucleoside triphosphate pyrophosphohydrolase [Sporomusa acidovorans]|uniref:Nucleoside triphosphate pyrophosphohydrolase n=1 Tax=Sporomusa acidovorans (strain ATCC 49682 / DSM 3132 / Mol) TaxID=1123286 RepID=A0ABZ3IX35_SPOA4|nr:nucleoside triphosphate pyrophosphohydrolase [Sporomusa acidovorans]OZC23646.1 nucleoside triphosphate pyrophosphohydrolase [Sporomusa acidovorans DSM 3132]SDE23843.1 tetrapyrrole methylase family protein / MazG family protein [Sporomusa acidovorans]